MPQPRSRPRNIEIVIEQDDDLRKKYLTSPNALHRGERDAELGVDYRRMTMRARCMLAALLTMSSGYRCDRAAIEAIGWELGAEALDGVLWELRSRGHLRIEQVNGAGGKFEYRWSVSRTGRQDWAESEVVARSKRASRARLSIVDPGVSAGQTMPGKTGHGSDSDDSDVTMPGSPDHGSPDHGSPDRGSPTHGQRGSYKEEGPGVKKDQEEKPPPPTPAPDDTAGTPPVEADGGGAILTPEKPEDPDAATVLDRILAAVPAARRPRGSRRKVLVDALVARRAAGWADDDLVDYLTAERFAGVTSVGAVLGARIGDLGDPPPPPAPREPAVRQQPRKAIRVKDEPDLLADGRLDREATRALIAEKIAGSSLRSRPQDPAAAS